MDTLDLSLTLRVRSFALELSLEVGPETVALVGPSGAGKSTTLRAIAGLHRPARGRIRVGTSVWFDHDAGVDLPPEHRSVGLLFQEYALFPHLTVAQNVAYGAGARVSDLLDAFELTTLRNERPDRLSGGERQRVALARALAREPRVLLLDEPLGALDTVTRRSVRADLRARLRRTQLPTLLVTHDYEDAAALADRIGVIAGGRIVQIGTATDLLAAPTTEFVASFVGANFLEGIARARHDGLTEVTLADGTRVVSTELGDGAVGVVVAPWDVAVARSRLTDSMQNHVVGEIESIVPVANRLRVRIGAVTAEITNVAAERLELREGERAFASFKATATRLVPL